MLFSAFFLVAGLALTFIDVEEFLLHLTSFQNQFSGHVSMLFSSVSLRLLSQKGHGKLQPSTSFKFIHALLPTSCNRLSLLAAAYC